MKVAKNIPAKNADMTGTQGTWALPNFEVLVWSNIQKENNFLLPASSNPWILDSSTWPVDSGRLTRLEDTNSWFGRPTLHSASTVARLRIFSLAGYTNWLAHPAVASVSSKLSSLIPQIRLMKYLFPSRISGWSETLVDFQWFLEISHFWESKTGRRFSSFMNSADSSPEFRTARRWARFLARDD